MLANVDYVPTKFHTKNKIPKLTDLLRIFISIMS